MSSNRPRLVIAANELPAPPEALDLLRSIFEVTEVSSIEEAAARVAEHPDTLLLQAGDWSDDTWRHTHVTPAGLLAILENIAEGVGVYEVPDDTDPEHGTLVWSNGRLDRATSGIRDIFASTCRLALREFDDAEVAALPTADRPSRKFCFAHNDAHFEAVISVASTEGDRVRSVVGIIWEVTETQRLQTKIDAIDAAGGELLQIDTESITSLNLAERLRRLEDRIIQSVCNVLHFDNFEVRLTDRDSGRLELVFLRGLTPMKIGEVIHARESGNGICGYVAATGRSYICRDTRNDPRYHEGMPEARSALTVPLRLHDQVIGVFNVESDIVNAFDENDRRFAEIYGRYIALSMNILDLLVVERYTTNEQLSENVLCELESPINSIRSIATSLRARARSDRAREELDRLLDSVGDIDRRLNACIKGPKSIIGAEAEDVANGEDDPILQGKHILLVDNEPVVLDAIEGLLRRRGCEVTACENGESSIEILQNGHGRTFDLVISDIRMGKFNGYEVFRAAKAVCAETPVILMTGFGYDPHHSIVRASQEGLHSFLFKPVKASKLLEAVQSALTA